MVTLSTIKVVLLTFVCVFYYSCQALYHTIYSNCYSQIYCNYVHNKDIHIDSSSSCGKIKFVDSRYVTSTIVSIKRQQDVPKPLTLTTFINNNYNYKHISNTPLESTITLFVKDKQLVNQLTRHFGMVRSTSSCKHEQCFVCNDLQIGNGSHQINGMKFLVTKKRGYYKIIVNIFLVLKFTYQLNKPS